jgi:ATP-binding cassette subfamily F protein uup
VGSYRERVICVDLAGVRMAQPDKLLFDDLSLTVASGDRVAIVGVNGSGKSTLMRILAGQQRPDAGDVRFGRGVRVALLDQDPQLPAGTVSEYLGESWEVAAVATSLGVQPLLERDTSELSGGQAKRVALARALVGEFDMIMLDEPTNHLDLEAIEWLERRLAATAAALVVITHDRHLMDRLTTARGEGRVVEIEGGRGHVHRAAVGASAYAAYLDGRAARHEQASEQESTRKILARRELAWLQRGAPARSTKPKARLRAAHDVVDGRPVPGTVRDDELLLDVGTTRLGNQVIELIEVSQSYGDGPAEHVVFRDVDLLIEPGARLGVVGPNGSGKSTLLDIIAGRTQPLSGTVKRGSTVVSGYADQQTSTLPPDAIVRELVAGPLRQPDWEDRALLERFWFDSTAQYAPVRMLSGGERRRLQLVMVLATKPNLLVLDEPTNDLDLDTLRALEGFLDEWPGALVAASHDRVFLDRTVDHVLAIDGAGRVARVPGGVEGWLAARASVPASVARAQKRPASSPAATSSPASNGTPARKPSQYTVGRQLRDTEQAMVKAQRLVDQLNEQLVGTVDHTELAAIGSRLTVAQTELSELETRWLDLAERQSG